MILSAPSPLRVCRPWAPALALAWACSDEDPIPALSAVSVELSEHVPTVATISWTTEELGRSQVRYGADRDLSMLTPIAEEATSEHRVVLLGLAAGQSYGFQAITRNTAGEVIGLQGGDFALEHAPAEVSVVTVTQPSQETTHAGGYLLTTLFEEGGSWVTIFDRSGEVVWYLQIPDRMVTSVRPGHDGRGFYLIHSDILQEDDVSEIEWFSIDGSERTATAAATGHHDVVQLEDRSYAFIGCQFRTFDDYHEEQAELAGDTIVEIREGGSEEDQQVVFDLFDHYDDPQPYCKHCFESAFNSTARDWSHANSLLTLRGQDDAYYLMASYLDTMFKVDRSNGEILWKMGGDDNQFTVPKEGLWSHPHLSQIWDGGMMVFDNGHHHWPQQSRIVELAWDESVMSLAQVWSFTHPEGLFNRILGDVKKIGDQRYLASWSQFGLITEIDGKPEGPAQGAVVWQLETQVGVATGRLLWIPDLYQLL